MLRGDLDPVSRPPGAAAGLGERKGLLGLGIPPLCHGQGNRTVPERWHEILPLLNSASKLMLIKRAQG